MPEQPKAPPPDQKKRLSLASTGIDGLDHVLDGGLPTGRLYLLDGSPGTGKTTMALQFLLAGAARGDRCLYVTLSESNEELRDVADSHGWSLDFVRAFELSAHDEGSGQEEAYTIFQPAEVEMQGAVDRLIDAVNEHQAQLVVLDSLSELRLLARDPLRFRRQILSLKRFFAGRACTVLMLDDKTAPEGDLQLHSLAHGVIQLEHVALEYGAERRRLQVLKLRGRRFTGGYHDFRIKTGGIAVYPRLQHEHVLIEHTENLSSGSRELDALLGGGPPKGTSILITGPAGTGKSLLATQFACESATRGEKTRLYLFDERLSTFAWRAEGLGLQVKDMLKDGRLSLCQIEPTERSPGEFAHDVVRAVEDDGVKLIVIDSINGYLQAMPEERLLATQVHELLSYLASRRVSVILTLVQRGIFGSPVDEAADVSYLADTVILLRYFEVRGTVRQAVSVVKKRSGNHERTIRECRVEKGGMKVGEPLHEFQGVLTGVPQYVGDMGPLMHGVPRPAASGPA